MIFLTIEMLVDVVYTLHMGIIYYAFCKRTMKGYVGQTRRSLQERKRDHKYGKTYFDKSLRKYHFNWMVLETCDDSLLNEREVFWISEKNTRAPNGYNLTSGGSGYIPVRKERKPKKCHVRIDKILRYNFLCEPNEKGWRRFLSFPTTVLPEDYYLKVIA